MVSMGRKPLVGFTSSTLSLSLPRRPDSPGHPLLLPPSVVLYQFAGLFQLLLLPPPVHLKL
jgi:hypothetical protein